VATSASIGGRPGTRRRSRRAWRGPSGADVVLVLVVLALAAATAFTVVNGLWIGLVGLLVIAVAFVAGLQDWRRSFVGLIVFLPYSGLFILAAYPASGPATLLKDLLFVLPIYAGFLGTYALRGRLPRIPGFPLGLALAFAAIVVLQMFAPTLPSVVVGLIGAKVWLMYVPLALVAFVYLRTRRDLDVLLTVMALAAVIPCLVGIVEGILVNTGRGDVVYGWYGDAASAATQEFSNVGVGTATIKRVPSTFSFVGQYSLFTIISFCVAYAWWRAVLIPRGRHVWMGPTLLGIVALAALLSGARGPVFALPALLAVMLVLDGIRLRTWVLAPALIVIALAVAASVFGTGLAELIASTWDHAIFEFDIGTVQGVEHALDRTYLGLGTGVDTVQARYGLPDFNPFGLVGGRVEEAWWIKAILELGLVGLVIVVAFVVAVLRATFRAHLSVRDPELRSVSAAFFALLTYAVFFNFKGAAMDLDPMNVIFWVFVGAILRMPSLQETPPDPSRQAARRPSAAVPATSASHRSSTRSVENIRPA
jgi:hypothetical protein